MKTEINVNLVQYIRMTSIKQTNWSFHLATPEIVKPFLGFLWNVTKEYARREGWGPSRIDESKMKEYNKVIIGNTVYEQARVYIRMKSTDISAYFNSNEEALSFIEELKEKSKNNFQVIEN